MRILLIISLVVLSLGIKAQKQDTTTYVYCDIAAISKYGIGAADQFFVNLFIDFGNGIVLTPDNPLKNEFGKDLTGAIDVINFLAKEGWILQTTTSFFMAQSSGRWVIHYILRKPKFLVK